MAPDYYEILGISEIATDSEVEKAYRRLAMIYHPDRNPHASAEIKFKEIREAYGVLSDRKRRGRYDRSRFERRQSEDDNDDIDARTSDRRADAEHTNMGVGKWRTAKWSLGLIGVLVIGIVILAGLHGDDGWSSRPMLGPQVGDRFQDCPECPEMVVVPAGSFQMEDVSYGETEVTIGTPFALGVYEVTVAEFGRFVDDTGYSSGNSCYGNEGGQWGVRADRHWRNPGFDQSGRHPAACVSLHDAQTYVAWLSRRTGEAYRLPSKSEWVYAARAGTATWVSCGESGQCRHENGAEASTAPVGSYAANGWGLHDMPGNVQEWTEDCWDSPLRPARPGDASGRTGSPADGSAWLDGDCGWRVICGGDWTAFGGLLDGIMVLPAGDRRNHLGFRVAKTFTP